MATLTQGQNFMGGIVNYDTQTGQHLLPGQTTQSNPTGSNLPSNPPTPPQTQTVATSGLANQNFNQQQAGFNQLNQGVQNQAQQNQQNQANPKVSIVDLLNSKGQASDYGSRSQLANQYGIQNYTGTAAQNMQLINLVNQGQQPQGQQTTTQVQGQPTTTTTTTPVQQPTQPATYEQKLSDVTQQQQNLFDQHMKDLEAIRSGTFPLSTFEQAQLDSTQQSLEQARTMQLEANKNYEKLAENAQFRTGRNLTDPSEFLAKNQQIISNDIQKISSLDNSAAITMNKLRQSFMDNDYKMINDQYTELRDILKSKSDTIEKVQARADKMAQDTRDFNEKVREFTVQHQDAQAIAKAQQNPVPMTQNGAPDSASQKAFLAQLPPQQQVQVKGIADYSINPSSFPTRLLKGQTGLTRADAIALAKSYDPSYDETQYASRQAVRTKFTSGDYSKNINALNTAVGHVSHLEQIMSSLHNRGFTPWNALANRIESTFGAGGVTAAKTNLAAATAELATTFKGSGATDQEIRNLGTIGPNASPDQVKSYLETALNLLGSRIGALNDTYAAGMGKAPENPFLKDGPALTLLNLKRQGLNIDIPGLDSTPVAKVIQFGQNNPEEQQKITQMEADGATYQDILDYYNQ